MTAALERPSPAEVSLASTLAGTRRRRRPMLGAVRAALSVLVTAAIAVVMLRFGPADAIAETLIFGAAAIVYVLADFAAELPPPRPPR
jgi:hypothetical protein